MLIILFLKICVSTPPVIGRGWVKLPTDYTMRCSILNSTNGTRCSNTCCVGLNICGVHRARSIPHELSFFGEKDTVYRDPQVNGYFSTAHTKVIFDCDREPTLALDPSVCQPKKILHRFVGQDVVVKWCDNKKYQATIKHVVRHVDGTRWCHLVYSNDGATQDVMTAAFKKRERGGRCILTLSF